MNFKRWFRSLPLCILLILFSLEPMVVFGGGSDNTEGIDGYWLRTLVSVEVSTSPDKVHPIGSGFLVKTPFNHFALVTAKHVILDDKGRIREGLAYRVNRPKQGSTLLFDTDLQKKGGPWFLSNSEDVACRFMGFYEGSEFSVVQYESLLPKEKVRTGAQVLVIGFPLGLRSEQYVEPIVRRGIVARADSNGILIDALLFPGNSGGPVIYAPTIKVAEPLIANSINKDMLIGLVSIGISYVETFVSQQTGKPRITFEDNAGLSNIVSAGAISSLLESNEFKKLDESGFKEKQ